MLSIEEGNKMIAEFMGYKFVSNWYEYPRILPFCKPYKSESKIKRVLANDLQYHTSWDWLMPVVEKIEDEKIGVIIRTWSCEISYRNGGSVISYAEAKPKIQAVYSAVIQFLTYINTPKI